MTTFTGTAGTDTFIGANNAKDLFRFNPADLSAADTVQGRGGDTPPSMIRTT